MVNPQSRVPRRRASRRTTPVITTATLKSLRNIGNTVIVVEHDEDTIRAADHIVEMGPGPGVHGGAGSRLPCDAEMEAARC